MTNQCPYINTQMPTHVVQVFRKRLPGKGYRCIERWLLDVFNHLEHGDKLVRLTGSHRRQGQRTVASDHCGHAMFNGGCRESVPAKLWVKMRVDIDEPRRNNLARCIDDICTRARLVDKQAIVDVNITLLKRCTCSVSDHPPSNRQVSHVLLLESGICDVFRLLVFHERPHWQPCVHSSTDA